MRYLLAGSDYFGSMSDDPIKEAFVCLTSSLTIFSALRKCHSVQYPHFSTCMRGFCHGISSLFLPVGAGRLGVAVRHAPLGVAKRPCHRVPNDTGAYTP